MKKLFMLLLMLLITTVATYAQMTEQWVSRYNGPRGYDDLESDMVIDALGNVYVTGAAFDSTEGNSPFRRYATVKYNSSGIEQWSAVYHPDTTDFAGSIGVDAAGNVYVTGQIGGFSSEHMATIKYNPFGVQQWSQIYAANGTRAIGMAVDASGNVYICGLGGLGYFTIKYNTNGVEQWTASYTNGYHYDVATSIAIDNIGNIYVTGSSLSSTDWDLTTIKYNSSGAQQWVQRHSGAYTTFRYGPKIITDNLGNVFVTSARSGTGTYTIKYNSSGVEQWVTGGCRSFALDLSGNLYEASNSATPPYYTTIKKYDAAGDSLWSSSFESYLGTDPIVAFDNCLGYVYVAIAGYDTTLFTYYYLPVRYNSYGDSLWSGRTSIGTRPHSIAVDGLGNLYLSGTHFRYGSSPYNDYATVKYTPSSFFVHTAKRDNLNKPINDNQSTSDSIFIDCSLMNYSTGDMRVNIDDLRHTKDSDLEIYLIHPATGDNGGDIIDTIVYQVGGTGQNFIGTIFSDSAAISINDGSAPFTGSFRPHRPLSQLNGLSMEGNWILKIYDRASGNEGVLKAWSIDFGLSSQTVGIQEIFGEVPGEFNLSQNYPNPFNPSTTIRYQLPFSGQVTLKVYDVLGREIAILVNEEKTAGVYEVSFNASQLSSGIYFYKLTAGNFIESMKMILLR